MNATLRDWLYYAAVAVATALLVGVGMVVAGRWVG